jgi:glyoxylase-like metal-dependent hydrolase (beta-lactamase superfamily II)
MSGNCCGGGIGLAALEVPMPGLFSFLLVLLGAVAQAAAPQVADLGPAGAPLPPMGARAAVCALPMMEGALPKRLALAEGALHVDVPAVQTGLLIVHPKGAFVVDGGARMDLEPSLSAVPAVQGLMLKLSARSFSRLRSLEAALKEAGAPAVKGALLTHAHYDHVGGLLEVADLPIYTLPGELEEAKRAAAGEATDILKADAEALLVRGRALEMNGPAYGPYPASHDLYGDGSVIVVPMEGHTPGSLGVFVHLPDGRRAFLVGDTVWVREGYELRIAKSSMASQFDHDRQGTAMQIGRLAQLYASEPGLVLVPAHDGRQWEALFGGEACLR